VSYAVLQLLAKHPDAPDDRRASPTPTTDFHVLFGAPAVVGDKVFQPRINVGI